MIEDMTPEEMKKRITPAMVAAGKFYFEKKKYADKIRPTILAEKMKIIQANRFCCDAANGEENAGKPITEVHNDWMMSDGDFARYIVECEKMYVRLGFTVPKDNCPLLIAEDEVRKAKQTLLETCQPILLGLTYNHYRCNPEKIDKVIDTLLQVLMIHAKICFISRCREILNQEKSE